jgi:hypothetical protein
MSSDGPGYSSPEMGVTPPAAPTELPSAPDLGQQPDAPDRQPPTEAQPKVDQPAPADQPRGGDWGRLGESAAGSTLAAEAVRPPSPLGPPPDSGAGRPTEAADKTRLEPSPAPEHVARPEAAIPRPEGPAPDSGRSEPDESIPADKTHGPAGAAGPEGADTQPEPMFAEPVVDAPHADSPNSGVAPDSPDGGDKGNDGDGPPDRPPSPDDGDEDPGDGEEPEETNRAERVIKAGKELGKEALQKAEKLARAGRDLGIAAAKAAVDTGRQGAATAKEKAADYVLERLHEVNPDMEANQKVYEATQARKADRRGERTAKRILIRHDIDSKARYPKIFHPMKVHRWRAESIRRSAKEVHGVSYREQLAGGTPHPSDTTISKTRAADVLVPRVNRARYRHTTRPGGKYRRGGN